MSPNIRCLLPGVLAFLGMGATLDPVGDPLPAPMVSAYTGGYAGVFCPVKDESKSELLSCRTVFDTAAKTLSIRWYWAAPGADTAYSEIDTHSLSFEPTAFCTKEATGPTFYVAGYIARTGHVVVEEWTIENLLLGIMAPQEGGESQSTLSHNIRKSVVLMSTDVAPIRSMLFNAPQGKLWLFEDQAPNVVWAMDPAIGNPVYVFDQTVLPALATHFSSAVMKVSANAPQGGGFVIMLFPWRDWDPKWSSPNQLLSSDTAYLLRDGNWDGVIDEQGLHTFWELKQTRQYWKHEVPY